MRAHHVGSLVIVDDERAGARRPVGIITDRDIVVSVVAMASPYLESLRVGDVATEPLVTAREKEGFVSALKKMRDDLLELFSEELSELAAIVTREQRREAQRRI
jgi:CBS domain-containing protein